MAPHARSRGAAASRAVTFAAAQSGALKRRPPCHAHFNDQTSDVPGTRGPADSCVASSRR
jgi:hypothetical protein